MIQRPLLIKFHLILAALLLPAMLMFAITGALYTWGVKGSYDIQTQLLTLKAPLIKGMTSLKSRTLTELSQHGLHSPTGQAKIKNMGQHFALEWTGSQYDVILSTQTGSHDAKLQIKYTDYYRYIVQLHKAKGGWVFKVYAVLLAFSLLLVLASGLLMGLSIAKYRKTTITALSLGIGLFVVAALTS